MITTNEYLAIEKKMAKATLDEALVAMQWLVYVQDVVHLDTPIGSAIDQIKELCKTPIMAPLVNPACTYARIRRAFSLAQDNGLEWPKIKLGTELNLTITANQSGQLNLTNDAAFHAPNNKWYGRIERRTGKIQLSHKLRKVESELILQTLSQFDENPAKFAKIYGKATGHCMFCSRKLTDSRSVAMGYGPTCAESYALPWGTDHADQIEMQLDLGDVK